MIPVYILTAISNVNLIHIKRWVLDLLTVMEEEGSIWYGKKPKLKNVYNSIPSSPLVFISLTTKAHLVVYVLFTFHFLFFVCLFLLRVGKKTCKAHRGK